MAQEQLDIFERYLLDAVRKTLPQRPWSPAPQGFDYGRLLQERQSRLGFLSPQLKGSIELYVSEDVLKETCPGFSDAGDQSSLYLDDWISELSNLMLGRLKAQLLAHDIDLKLVTSEKQKTASESPQELYWERKACLMHETNGLLLAYRVHFDPTLDLSCSVHLSPHSLQPGNAVFRLSEAMDQKNRYDMVYKVRSGVDVGNEEEIDDIFAEDYSAPVKPYIPSGLNPTEGVQVRASVHLTGLDWKRQDCLVLTFVGARRYEFNPSALLQKQDHAVIEIEALHLEFRKESDGIAIFIPELQISMRHSLEKSSA